MLRFPVANNLGERDFAKFGADRNRRHDRLKSLDNEVCPFQLITDTREEVCVTQRRCTVPNLFQQILEIELRKLDGLKVSPSKSCFFYAETEVEQGTLGGTMKVCKKHFRHSREFHLNGTCLIFFVIRQFPHHIRRCSEECDSRHGDILLRTLRLLDSGHSSRNTVLLHQGFKA